MAIPYLVISNLSDIAGSSRLWSRHVLDQPAVGVIVHAPTVDEKQFIVNLHVIGYSCASIERYQLRLHMGRALALFARC